MNSPRNAFRFTLPVLAALVALSALLLGCATPPAEPQQSVAGAVELTEPPPATPTNTPLPPTPSATPTLQPTDTPTPQPTYTPRPAPTKPAATEREPAVQFQARLLDGAELSLSETQGTPTLLAFWAPW